MMNFVTNEIDQIELPQESKSLSSKSLSQKTHTQKEEELNEKLFSQKEESLDIFSLKNLNSIDEIKDDDEPTEIQNSLDLLSLDEVEMLLCYNFKNKSLLEEALTHVSYPNRSFSYERLEYIGDSILNFIFTKEHYFKYPELSPGCLTRLRAANVDKDKLSRAAVKLGLHHYLRHNQPTLKTSIENFEKEVKEFPLHSNGLINAPKVLSDIVESLIGAVYVDCNSLDIAWKVFKDVLEPIITPETIKIHPVTQLVETCQKNNLKLKFVDYWNEDKRYDVLINDERMGSGIYVLKKEIAQNRAAQDALSNLKKIITSDEKLCGSDQPFTSENS